MVWSQFILREHSFLVRRVHEAAAEHASAVDEDLPAHSFLCKSEIVHHLVILWIQDSWAGHVLWNNDAGLGL